MSWVPDYYSGLSTSPGLTVHVSRELTEEEVVELTDLVEAYVDPEEFLVFSRAETYPMQSLYTSGSDEVLQSIIFTNRNDPESVLDGLKTIVEYQPLSIFDALPEHTFTLEIFDLTRNTVIASATVALNTIATSWTVNVSKSLQYSGIRNRTTDHDCIWQFRATVSHPELFACRLHSLQYLFYLIE
jgi:hypothetical protein